jgi:hypothetical protein
LVADKGTCQPDDLRSCLARVGHAGLGYESRGVGGFVAPLAGSVEAFKQLLGVVVGLVECGFES